MGGSVRAGPRSAAPALRRAECARAIRAGAPPPAPHAPAARSPRGTPGPPRDRSRTRPGALRTRRALPARGHSARTARRAPATDGPSWLSPRQERHERAAQLFQPGPHARLDRPQRLLQLGSDLRLRESAEVRELDDATLRLRQLGERALHHAPRFLALDTTVGGFSRGGDRGREALAVPHRRSRQGAGPPAPRPDEVERAGPRDGREPRRHAAASRVEPLGGSPRLAERVGYDFLGVRPLAHDGERQRVDGSSVAVVQLAQGPLVTPGHALDEHTIRYRGTVFLAVHHTPWFARHHANRTASNLALTHELRKRLTLAPRLLYARCRAADWTDRAQSTPWESA